MKQKLNGFILVIFTFGIGLFLGVIMDKDWLSNEHIAYMKNMQYEREMLEHERQMWLAYVSQELGPLDIYISSDHDTQFSQIKKLLEPVGLTAKKIDTFDTLLEKDGILITLGQEMEIDANLQHLALEVIPGDMLSAQKFYLSLLRLKGERMNGEG